VGVISILDKSNRKLRALAAFLLGALASLAMAPYHYWFLLIISLGGFYLLIRRTSSVKGAFCFGWLFGFGYFFTGLFWVKNALLVDGNPFSWIWPLAVAGLPSLLAFFTGCGAAGAKRLANFDTAFGFLSFTAFIALSEWARGWVFTGYPWNLFGMAWGATPEIVQFVALGNIYFLTWLSIIWFTVPAYMLLKPRGDKGRFALSWFAALTLAACLLFGNYRLGLPVPENVPGVDIHIVQPNIKQSEKWNRTKSGEHFLKAIELSKAKTGSPNKTIIVWPETALGFWLAEDPQAIQYITSMLDSYPGGAVLLTGMLRHEADTENYYNSLVMIDSAGNISNIYNKHHLVPFGEYIPFQKYIPLKPVVEFTGFVLGDGVHTFEALGIKYSPVICYEIIFPGKVAGPDLPDVIVNITNDAWYGVSAGPHQHFTQAMFRAVEEGIPVVRSANTGFSGLIDPLGKVHEMSGLYIEYEKTLALPSHNMIYRNYHTLKNVIFIGLVLFVIVTGFVQTRRRQNVPL
jgi:apolipoprotein N-acyltransferase